MNSIMDKNRKLIKHEMFEADGRLYLDLMYRVEDDHDIRLVHIPKVRLPIEYATLESPEIFNPITGKFNDDPESPVYLRIHNEYFPCEKDSIDFYECSVSSIDEPLGYYGIKIIEEKRVEMTVEEIEAKLGYRVNIVSSNETINRKAAKKKKEGD